MENGKWKMGAVIALTLYSAFYPLHTYANDTIVRDGRTVTFANCEKCDKWMRFGADARSATINLARVKDRKAVTKRAFMLMALADDTRKGGRNRPLMGWSSWNTFRVNISEEIILSAARAMATNGLKAAGYRYVNIDDGFFDGHGPDGVLRFHPGRFPNGMKGTVDGIHALGFKAGIYSDAGADTCGSVWDADKGGIGAGLYGHDDADCKLHFLDLGFDFIKIDYCGGQKLNLDERQRYTEIAEAIKRTGRKDVRFNVCRWAFPGTWVADIADSWRTTGDIRANWSWLKSIIRENLYLSPFMKKGHFNDMDMLQVGHYLGQMEDALIKDDIGLTLDEEQTHFGLWCILSSPLLIGCDVRMIPESTKDLVTNPYLLMMNQNDLGLQAYVAKREGDSYVFVKDADRLFGTARYVAMYNGSDKSHTFRISARELDLGGAVQVLDLVERADLGYAAEPMIVTVKPHATRFFRLDAEKRLERAIYEAETAFLSEYQELKDAAEVGTAHVREYPNASGGVAVCFLGNRETNDLVWRDVDIHKDGRKTLEFRCSSPDGDRVFDVQIDGGKRQRLMVPSTKGDFTIVSLNAKLTKGLHTIRLSSANSWAPDIDWMRIMPCAGKPDISYEDGLETFETNPARGAAGGGWVVFKPEGLPNWHGQGGYHSSLWELSRFSGGREERGKRPSPERVGTADIPITDAMKRDVRRFLTETREKKGTLIVRLGYTWSDQAGCEPSDFNVLLGHIRDLSRIISEFDDLVVAVEAGIAGPWGEMHSSVYCEEKYMNRILKTYLENLGPRIPVLVRSPGYFNKFAGTTTEELLGQLPFNDPWLKRLGMYNDGYLGTWWDYGTWAGNFTRERGCQLLKAANHLPYGGEMAYVSKDWLDGNRERIQDLFNPEKWNIVRDWYDVHLNYLRNIHEKGHTIADFLRNDLVFDSKRWAFDGMPDLHEYDGEKMGKFVLDHMGYRFVIRDARLPTKMRAGEKTRIALEIENTGFGSLLLPYQAEIIFGDNLVVPARLSLDIPGGHRKRVSVTFTIPQGKSIKGTEEIALRVTALQPIRFANRGIWNEAIRANRLRNAAP